MAMHLSVALFVALTGTGQAPADPHAQAIAPFITDEVALVFHADLTRVKIDPLARQVLAGMMDDSDELNKATQSIDQWTTALRKAGAKDLFVLIDPTQVPSIPLAVVPLSEGADADAIGKALRGEGDAKPPYTWQATATEKNAVIGTTKEALERVKQNKPAARPDLADAFAATPDACARVLILPSVTHRRVVEEMIPNLPKEFGGGPVSKITQGLRWVSIALDAKAKPTLRVVGLAKDPEAAKALAQIARDALKLVEDSMKNVPAWGDFAKNLEQVKVETGENRVTANVDLERASSLVGTPAKQARENARRIQCINNLKQLGLAMFNYLDVNKTFPPNAIRDKSGKPLLSWRVAILPYIDQEALYKEFHLDEAWDSPHNKALIERIPPTLVCPGVDSKLKAEGKTVYVVPVGKDTIFPPDGTGTKINDINDGTSNTALIVETSPDHAPIWTRPDDVEIGDNPKAADFFGHQHGDRTNIGWADGSVRAILEGIDAATLKAILSRSGGEVYDPSKF